MEPPQRSAASFCSRGGGGLSTLPFNPTPVIRLCDISPGASPAAQRSPPNPHPHPRMASQCGRASSFRGLCLIVNHTGRKNTSSSSLPPQVWGGRGDTCEVLLGVLGGGEEGQREPSTLTAPQPTPTPSPAPIRGVPDSTRPLPPPPLNPESPRSYKNVEKAKRKV